MMIAKLKSQTKNFQSYVEESKILREELNISEENRATLHDEINLFMNSRNKEIEEFNTVNNKLIEEKRSLLHEASELEKALKYTQDELIKEKSRTIDLENKVIALTSMVNINLGIKAQLIETKKCCNEERDR